MRKTDEQKKAAYQQRIAVLRTMVRRIEKREADADRRARARRLIVSGALVEELLPKFRDTAFAGAFIAAVREHLAAHPADADSFAELLERLTAPAEQREAAE
jgi:AcrR family transcriptional regulator